MNEQQFRLQCLQQAQQALQYTGQPGSVQHAPEAILALAEKMFTWVIKGV